VVVFFEVWRGIERTAPEGMPQILQCRDAFETTIMEACGPQDRARPGCRVLHVAWSWASGEWGNELSGPLKI
jgi:hypothetical protein